MNATAGDAFRAGDVPAAVAAATAGVKAAPTDPGARWLLAEMLLFDGNLDRADKVLEAAALREPSPPVLEFRRLIRGEVARRQCFAEGRVPRFQGGAPTPALEASLRAAVLLRSGDEAGAAEAAAEADRLRPRAPGRREGGGAFDDLRDGDDVLAPLVEAITLAGDYMWIPVERLRRLAAEPPRRPRDLFWARCAVETGDGTEGVVYVPCLYSWGVEGAPDAAALRLGRATDWIEPPGGGPVRGRGQRLLLLGEEAVALAELGDVALTGAGTAAA